MIAARIRRMNLDVLAVLEIEDIDTLRFFDAQELDHSAHSRRSSKATTNRPHSPRWQAPHI
ncbi:hypothetical protein [Streptomyces inhibens]|uniref:hypothetical protein n=1 Tax=Streptomyces inhibens TaxID=2293571 RepID=UPI001EE76C02|nr:hypothetical protein [Streptomyces inhibens]UKY48147.1 hypothetical protein KI385_04505 [Streptomyces inhibens]